MTKLNCRWIPVLAIVLLTPLAARAGSVEAQSIELNGFFSFDHTSASVDLPGGGSQDLNTTIFDLEPGLGYFFTPNWELLGNLIISHQSVADFSTDHFGLKASGYYHFNTTGTVIPFAGVGLGFLSNGGDADGDASVIVPELVVGIRYPFKNIVSFNFTGGYRHETNYLGVDTSGDSFFLGAGFSMFLRGGTQ